MEQTSNVLPEDFDGVFRFTNPTEEDFVGKWGGVEYMYPAMKTTPMFIRNATPEETQYIRKKFAKDLATREYFKSKALKSISPKPGELLNSIHQANTYNDNDLAPFIQKCLDPLPMAKAVAVEAPKKNIEDELTRDEDGELNTQIAAQRQPLKLKNKER